MNNNTECRLCDAPNSLINLYPHESNKNVQLLRYIITLASSVVIKPDDIVSKMVCHRCCKIAIQLHRYRTNALSNDKKLKEQFAPICMLASKNNQEKFGDVNNIIPDDSMKFFSEILNFKDDPELSYQNSHKKASQAITNHLENVKKLETESKIISRVKYKHPSIKKLQKECPNFIIPEEVFTDDISPVISLDEAEVTDWYETQLQNMKKKLSHITIKKVVNTSDLNGSSSNNLDLNSTSTKGAVINEDHNKFINHNSSATDLISHNDSQKSVSNKIRANDHFKKFHTKDSQAKKIRQKHPYKTTITLNHIELDNRTNSITKKSTPDVNLQRGNGESVMCDRLKQVNENNVQKNILGFRSNKADDIHGSKSIKDSLVDSLKILRSKRSKLGNPIKEMGQNPNLVQSINSYTEEASKNSTDNLNTLNQSYVIKEDILTSSSLRKKLKKLDEFFSDETSEARRSKNLHNRKSFAKASASSIDETLESVIKQSRGYVSENVSSVPQISYNVNVKRRKLSSNSNTTKNNMEQVFKRQIESISCDKKMDTSFSPNLWEKGTGELPRAQKRTTQTDLFNTPSTSNTFNEKILPQNSRTDINQDALIDFSDDDTGFANDYGFSSDNENVDSQIETPRNEVDADSLFVLSSGKTLTVFICAVCSLVCDTKRQLVDHERTHLTCKFCKKKIKNLQLLVEHLNDTCVINVLKDEARIQLVRVDEIPSIVDKYQSAFSNENNFEDEQQESDVFIKQEDIEDTELEDIKIEQEELKIENDDEMDVICITDDDDDIEFSVIPRHIIIKEPEIKIDDDISILQPSAPDDVYAFDAALKDISSETDMIKTLFKKYYHGLVKFEKSCQTFKNSNRSVKRTSNNIIFLDRMYSELLFYTVPVKLESRPNISARFMPPISPPTKRPLEYWGHKKTIDIKKCIKNSTSKQNISEFNLVLPIIELNSNIPQILIDCDATPTDTANSVEPSSNTPSSKLVPATNVETTTNSVTEENSTSVSTTLQDPINSIPTNTIFKQQLNSSNTTTHNNLVLNNNVNNIEVVAPEHLQTSSNSGYMNASLSVSLPGFAIVSNPIEGNRNDDGSKI